MLQIWLIVLHVVAVVTWIGSILAVGIILAAPHGEPRVRGALALQVYKRLAVPAFSAAFVFGVWRLVEGAQLYFVATKFMHAKLTLAVVVIALHHVLGGRAKALASGRRTDAPGAAMMTGVIGAAAAVIVALVLLKPF
jgi:putative membrane protein